MVRRNLGLPHRLISKNFNCVIWVKISFNSMENEPKVFVLNNKMMAANTDKMTVYINGKIVDKSVLNKMNPNEIASMNVFKTNGTGKIEVITK